LRKTLYYALAGRSTGYIVEYFLIINQLDAPISQIYSGRKLYMFQTVPLSIIRSFSLYAQQWHMSYRFADIYHCCVYSEILLMTERGTVQNMYSFLPE